MYRILSMTDFRSPNCVLGIVWFLLTKQARWRWVGLYRKEERNHSQQRTPTQGIRKKMPVLERSSHRYMSDEGREKAGYSKLAGFAAIVTKPYRPIGDLGGVMQNNRRPERGGSSSTTSTFDTDATKKHGRSTSPLHREAPASTNSLDSSSNHYPRVRFSNKAYGQSLKPRLQTRRNDVSCLRVGSTANGGIFSFVRAPHALELANHTARHAFHAATQKYGGHARDKHAAHTSRTIITQHSSSPEPASHEQQHHQQQQQHEYDHDDDDDEDVRLKTRNEIWAEAHLANVQSNAIKIKTPKRLKSKFTKVDQKFRDDLQTAHFEKYTSSSGGAGGVGRLQKGKRESAWRIKEAKKQQIKRSDNHFRADAAATSSPGGGGGGGGGGGSASEETF